MITLTKEVQGYPNVTFKHLGALGKVLRKMKISMNMQHFKARVIWFFFLFLVKQGN
jgi:hypothetical protein